MKKLGKERWILEDKKKEGGGRKIYEKNKGWGI
jgi:hypothetical protein